MKDKISNFFNGSYRLLCIVMVLLWGMLVFLTITNLIPSTSVSSSFIIILGTIIYLLFLVFVYRKIEKFQPKTHDKIALVITCLSFILLALWSLTHQPLPHYDLYHIIDKIKILFHNNTHIIGEHFYFSKYPHQIPIFILTYFVEYIGKIIFNAPDVTMIVFNCFMIALSFYFVYKIIKELANSKLGIIGLILCVLYIDYYLLGGYYYTDILCVPYATIGFYFLIKANKLEGLKKFISLILGGILFGIATKMRVVASFLFIGYLIVCIYIYIINGKKLGKFKEFIKNGFIPVIAFFSIFLLHNILVNQYFKIEINKEATYPVTHFIMMGLNTDTFGNYSDIDDSFTYNSKNKTQDTKEVIKERIKDINLDFYINKFASNWTIGKHTNIGIYHNVSTVDDSYAFLTGYNMIFIQILSQITLLTIYLLFLLTIIKEAKNKKVSMTSTLIITIFGAILFYLIWEANGRYSFSFLEWIIIGAALSFEEVNIYLKKKLQLNGKTRKSIGYLLIFSIVLILIDGFLEYAYKREEINVPRYIQYGIGWRLYQEDKEIKQIFLVNDTFNKINLTFNDSLITEEIPYQFELYNMEDVLLYKEEFMATKNKGTTNKYFKFKNIEVNQPTKFYIKIYSDEATPNNYLRLSAFITDNCLDKPYDYPNYGYKIMPSGETYVDNKKSCFELTMKVYENKESNKFRKKYYLVYAGIVMLITYLGIYESFLKKEKKNSK